jgi:CRISPR-associated protein Cas1
MEITVESKGSKIFKRNNIFRIKRQDNEEVKISYTQVKSFVLYPGVDITTDAINLALEKNVDIHFVDDYGMPVGRIWNNKFGSTSLIRREQCKVFSTIEGSEIGKEFILKKVKAYAEHLKELAYEGDKINDIEKFTQCIIDTVGIPNDIRNVVMAYEGNIGKIYLSCISEKLPEKYKFNGRSLGGKDYYNSLLNYSYGMLYRICEIEIVKAGLDPFMGIFHADSYNKKSFLFDFIESFRPNASKIVYDFIKKKYIRSTHFQEDFKLTTEGRVEISRFFKKNFEKKRVYEGKNWDLYSIIRLEAQKLARTLKGDKDEISDIL